MMKLFFLIDSFLIDFVFEKIAHHFQKLTGKTCFFLAKNCCFAAILCFALSCLLELTFLNFMANLLIIYLSLKNSRMFHFMDRIADILAERKTGNPLRLNLFIFRIMIIFVLGLMMLMPSSGTLNEAPYHLGWILYGAALYFGSCNSLPPGTSKVRKWVESIKKAFSSVTPEPATAIIS